MKKCTACGRTKTFSEFERYVDNRPKLTRRRFSVEHRKTADGYRGQCRVCRRKLPNRQGPSREAERRRLKAKAGKIYTPLSVLKHASEQKRLATDEERRRQRDDRAYLREMRFWWHQGTPSTMRYRIRYRSDPVFREKEITRRWVRKIEQRNIKGDGTLTPEVLQQLFAAAKSCCYCSTKLRSQDKTLDHQTPLSRGGIHSIHNAAICCRSCNSRKSDTPYETWLERVAQGRVRCA
jgi:5-methylcytosine-specific restriction endonuclease McrA